MTDEPAPGAEPPAPAARPAPAGLQAERTALAWQRTAIGIALGCAVLSLSAIREGDPVLAVVAVLLGAANVTGSLLARHGRWPPTHRRPWAMLVPGAGAVVVLAVLGVVASALRAVR